MITYILKHFLPMDKMMPFSKLEKGLVQKYQLVVGVDESGRGPLAGPVTAAAAAVTGPAFSISKQLKDSKKLSPKKREEIFEILKQHPQVEWGLGRVSEKVIDRMNIFEATKLAMERAIKNLEKKLARKQNFPLSLILHDRGELATSRFLLIDGNFGINLNIPQQSIIKGDEKIFLIKIASIVAKVTRDRLMLRHHKKHPQYGFDTHKGYGTKLHVEMLKKYGPCGIHRRSFRPLRENQK